MNELEKQVLVLSDDEDVRKSLSNLKHEGFKIKYVKTENSGDYVLFSDFLHLQGLVVIDGEEPYSVAEDLITNANIDSDQILIVDRSVKPETVTELGLRTIPLDDLTDGVILYASETHNPLGTTSYST